jgi:hypothetical protein
MENRLNDVLRLSAIFILTVWLFSSSLLYQSEYPTRLVELYEKPWWKLLLIVLTISAFMWCENVGILLAFAVIMYFSDLETLTK